jgi:hypothetical protein
MATKILVRLQELESHITVLAFLKAARQLLYILQEVESSMSNKRRASLTWVVSDLRLGSTTIAVSALPSEGLPYTGEAVVSAVVEGLRLLENSATRPRYFSDDALDAAKELALMVGKEARAVTVSVDSEFAELTARTVYHANELQKTAGEELGTIEGVLKMVTLVDRPYFNVYDEVTGRPVRCDFDMEELAKIALALGRRVSVSGLIIYGADSYPRRVRQVTDFTVFPPDENLPGIEDILQTGIDLSGGLSFREFMNKIRNGNG